MKSSSKLLFLLLSCSLLVSGCGNSTTQQLDYKNNASSNSVTIPCDEEEKAPSGYLFSSDKCVIDSKTNDADPNITASAAMIVDQTDLKPIFSSNVFEKLYPASITKILTAYITLKYANLDDIVTVSHEAANITEEGTKLCGYNENDKVSVRDLLYSMLIYSGNDAATALACHISGSEDEFAKLMNEEAASLGATGSHFTNSNGLHNDNHYTTAYDLYLIFSECIKNDEFKNIISQTSYTVNYTDADGNEVSKTFDSTNKFLLGEKEAPQGVTVIGGKTGTTSKAGNCLILYSEDLNGHGYISIILNADSKDSLYEQMTDLLSMINM